MALRDADYPVLEIVYRSNKKRATEVARKVAARAVSFNRAKLSADVVWICVADREIAQTAGESLKKSAWKGQFVFHASGALSSDELAVLKQAGAAAAAVHPMMSFVRQVEGSFEGVSFAIEGERKAERVAAEIAIDLGGTWFRLNKKNKPLYHALGAFSSPLIVAHLAAAERIGRELGLESKQTRKVIAPILRKTLSNYLERGPAAALSGPLLRGDLETIKQNLDALQRVPGTAEIYRELAKIAVEDLPVEQAAAIKKILRK
jgi:predicted short-subunit dehydrogenase-like oxidoreductase (DUF2520 family)